MEMRKRSQYPTPPQVTGTSICLVTTHTPESSWMWLPPCRPSHSLRLGLRTRLPLEPHLLSLWDTLRRRLTVALHHMERRSLAFPRMDTLSVRPACPHLPLSRVPVFSLNIEQESLPVSAKSILTPVSR